MKGITFGNYHSFRDFRLILSPNNAIGTPTPKYELIDVPGGDGMLDFTEAFGEVKYGNRPMSFEFSTMVPQTEFLSLFATVQKALHGQKMKIILDDDPDFYYMGRITVSEWKASRLIGKLTIDCDCEPFKYRVASQIVNLSGRNLLNIDAGTATHEASWTRTATGYTFTRGATTGGSFAYWTIPVKKGQQYIFSAGYSSTERGLYVYRDRLYGTLVAVTTGGAACVFTPKESGMHVLGVYVAGAEADGTFTNIMLQEGNVVGNYEAYSKTEKAATATFQNTLRPAVPKVHVHGNMTAETEQTTLSLPSGTNTMAEFVFYQGDTTLTFKGYGYAVVEWLERGL